MKDESKRRERSGGPAFPVNPVHNEESPRVSGLTRRQYYAAMALSAASYPSWSPKEVAENCFDLADALVVFEENEK